jgi:glycerol-3-phosphate cytidylyltransferase-like family protein
MQAKALGDVLVVGLIPDSEILRCKGPPVLNERERYLLVDAVKWVDEVVKGDKGHSMSSDRDALWCRIAARHL